MNNKQVVNLLSIEREQKLDLLIHLITNLQQPLILQGALGVGKTTLLLAVESRKADSADIFLLNLVWEASFESIQAQLVEFIKHVRKIECDSLSDALEAYAQQELQLVLLIDDANQLVSGLMGTLIDYAGKYRALRLVFALTPEEHKEKSQLEKIKASCHFVVLPALNIRQCEAFIRLLVEQATSIYTIKDIDSVFVDEVYQETKGNPGKISAVIKSANKRRLANSSMLTLIVVAVFICSAFVSVFLWQEAEQESPKLVPALTQATVESINPSSERETQQEIEVEESSELNELEWPFEQHIIEVPVTVGVPPLIEMVMEPVIDKVVPIDSVIHDVIALEPDKVDKLKEDEVLVEQGSQVEVIKVELEKKAEDSVFVLNVQDDRKWVLAQQKQQYTLQLMSLSAKKKLLEEQEKYQKLGVKTFYLEKKVKQSRSYVLFYGVFASSAEAKKQMKKLPKELQKSWPRVFSAIQKDL
ncbi:MAG: SPOR domain-containing protein [Methyloprofundus sp.]|nr:SPOR domain-containing protein [Methyloprofundus sp.]MDT8425884.1 SPOR domain-containing protein [Methyloprofundus sp.]